MEENSAQAVAGSIDVSSSDSGTAGVGRPAAAFDLMCVDASGDGQRPARFKDYAGRWLILLFYPRDFSFVCPTELTAFSARIGDFRRRGVELLGLSVDSLDMHREWLDTPPAQGGLGPLQFSLASDPDGATARAYGVWNADKGVSTRGLFVIDPDGVLQYSVVHNLSVGRSTDEVLRVIDALQTGGLCPASWTRADGTLDPESALQPGRVLGHYRIRRPLGTGSFGNVFDAWDLRLERPVALKVLKRYGSESRDVLLNEARAAARLNHPHVCTVYAVEEEDGLPVIVMELLEGRSLSALIAAGLGSDAVATLARQIASGLAEAHQREIVHGDLKPANVIVTRDGRAKILDFGLAAARGRPVGAAAGVVRAGGTPQRVPASAASSDEAGATVVGAAPAEAGAASSGTVAGTPAYMSPEQARGEPATPASDVYAFGLTLYEMLTGRRALDAESAVEVVLRLRSGDVAADVAKELSAPYRDLVTATLAREAARRPSMGEVGEWLEQITTPGT